MCSCWFSLFLTVCFTAPVCLIAGAWVWYRFGAHLHSESHIKLPSK